MSRPPSITTQLRTAKRLLANSTAQLRQTVSELHQARRMLTSAQQERDEWKRRFDQLLAAGFKGERGGDPRE